TGQGTCVKLVLFDHNATVLPGVMVDQAVVDVRQAVPSQGDAQRTMESIIDGFEDLRPRFERLVDSAERIPLDRVRLKSPLPRPGKIMCCIANYWEHAQRAARPLNMFLKNPDAVIGPGDTVRLPDFTDPYVFQHEAELGIVIKGPAKKVSAADWQKAVFGYTGVIDVSARAQGRQTWRQGSWMG